MNNKIFVALSTFAQYGDEPLNLLKDSSSKYLLNPLGRRLLKEEIIEMGRDASGIIAGVEPYDEEVLSNLPKLQCISRAGVGIDNVDFNYAMEKNISIRNTPDVVIRPVVELTLAMIFDLLRKTTFHTILLKNRRWEKSAGNLLFGKTVGIIGTGRIGKEVALLLKNVGANIIAYDVIPDQDWSFRNSIKYVSFEKLLSKSDIVTLHASPPSEQLPLIGKEEIALQSDSFLLEDSTEFTTNMLLDETSGDRLLLQTSTGESTSTDPVKSYIKKEVGDINPESDEYDIIDTKVFFDVGKSYDPATGQYTAP